MKKCADLLFFLVFLMFGLYSQHFSKLNHDLDKLILSFFFARSFAFLICYKSSFYPRRNISLFFDLKNFEQIINQDYLRIRIVSYYSLSFFTCKSTKCMFNVINYCPNEFETHTHTLKQAKYFIDIINLQNNFFF